MALPAVIAAIAGGGVLFEAGRWLLGFLKTAGTATATVALIVFIPNLLLSISLELFDLALYYTVLDFAQTINVDSSTGLMGAITNLWTVIRDISNILIIGAFVYISIAKILSIEKNFRRAVVALITVAILINFSFFFTLVLIDISNWMSVQIYNAINPIDGETIAETIMNEMRGGELTTGFAGTWDTLKTLVNNEQVDGVAPQITYFVLILVFISIYAILFFRMTFIFIARFVTIFILLATSSLAFAAMLIPSLNKYWISWRNGLIYNSIVVPILMLMLYMILNIMRPLYKDITIESIYTTDNNNFASIFIIFFIGTGLLWGAVRVATMLSNKAADSLGGLGRSINGLLNWTQGRAGAGVFAGYGWVGRNSLGRMGEWARGGLSSMADRTNSRVLRNVANWAVNSTALKKMATSSYDARQSKLTQEFMRQAGLNVGSGIKEGFKKIQEQKKKEQYDAGIARINSERPARNAADSARREEEEKLSQQQEKLEEQRRQLAEMGRESAERIAQEERAVQSQKEVVDKKDQEVKNIKTRREQASNIIREAAAQMQAETREIKRIENQIQAKEQQIDIGIRSGNLIIGSPELTQQQDELKKLHNIKEEHRKRLDSHINANKEAQEMMEQSPQQLTTLEQELEDEKAKLQDLQKSHEENAATGDSEDMALLQTAIREKEEEIANTQSKIQAYTDTLQEYTNRWQSILANTRRAKASPPLTDRDRDWLSKRGVVIDESGNILKTLTVAQIDALSALTRLKLDKLLAKNAEHLKSAAQIQRDSSMSKAEIKKQEEAAKIRKAFMSVTDSINNPAQNTQQPANTDTGRGS